MKAKWAKCYEYRQYSCYLAGMNKMSYFFKNSNQPILLLLHGFLGSKKQWNEVIKNFEKEFAILTVELPGHGESLSCDEYSIINLALEISQYLINHKIKKVHFVGHSMGGYVGAAFAKTYPQQLHSLTLINSITGADQVARKLMRDRSIKLIDRYQDAYISMAINNLFTKEEHVEYKEIITAVKSQAQKITLESVMAALRAMRDRPSQARIEEVPVQYVYGNRDTVIDKLLIEKELEQNDYKSFNLDGGHMLLLTHTKELTKLVNFVK